MLTHSFGAIYLTMKVKNIKFQGVSARKSDVLREGIRTSKGGVRGSKRGVQGYVPCMYIFRCADATPSLKINFFKVDSLLLFLSAKSGVFYGGVSGLLPNIDFQILNTVSNVYLKATI